MKDDKWINLHLKKKLSPFKMVILIILLNWLPIIYFFFKKNIN